MSQLPPPPTTGGLPTPFGAGPPPPLPPSPTRKGPSPVLVTVLTVVVVLAAAGGVLALTGGSSDDEPQGTTTTTDRGEGSPVTTTGPDEPSGRADEPEDAVDALIDAAAEADCEAFTDLFSDNLLGEESRADALETCERDPLILDWVATSFERTGQAEVVGATATVPVDGATNDYSVVVAILLVKEDGTWKIDDLEYDTHELRG